MQTTELIIVNEFCVHHHVDMNFIDALKDSGLIEVCVDHDQLCINKEELPQLEKLVRLYEMDINLEGIETITYLLQRVNELQRQVNALTSRLQFYENEGL